jgi:hypothetical protein
MSGYSRNGLLMAPSLVFYLTELWYNFLAVFLTSFEDLPAPSPADTEGSFLGSKYQGMKLITHLHLINAKIMNEILWYKLCDVLTD